MQAIQDGCAVRPARCFGGGQAIQFVEAKRANDQMKRDMVLCAKDLGYDQDLATIQKEIIVKASARIVCYDYGYRLPVTARDIPKWLDKFKDCTFGKRNFNETAHAKKTGPTKDERQYHQQIESDYPQLLLKIYRAAIKEIGCESSWKDIAESMNIKSRYLNQQNNEIPVLKMNRDSLMHWFCSHLDNVTQKQSSQTKGKLNVSNGACIMIQN